MIVDTNVIIDLLENTGPAEFFENVSLLMAENDTFVNEIVFAELAGRFISTEATLDRLEQLGLKMRRLSLDDCHRAGAAFRLYRRGGGTRATILPDFLIGAHAAGQGWPIVTRDRKGFAKYFPKIELIDPYKAMP